MDNTVTIPAGGAVIVLTQGDFTLLWITFVVAVFVCWAEWNSIIETHHRKKKGGRP